jgi:SAM-dependent methyltransferase
MSDAAYAPELYALVHRGVRGDEAFYTRACKRAENVLELGCGYGRLIPALASTGARYQGLEIDPAFLRLAQRVRRSLAPALKAQVSLRLGDMRDFQFRQRFDRILLPHSTLYCLQSERDVLRCLRAARAHLTDDGELILDAYLADHFHDTLQPKTMTGKERDFLATVADEKRKYLVFERTRWLRPKQRFVVTYEYESDRGELSKGVIHHRYLLRTQLERLLARAGFQVKSLAGTFKGARLGPRSEHLVLRASPA